MAPGRFERPACCSATLDAQWVLVFCLLSTAAFSLQKWVVGKEVCLLLVVTCAAPVTGEDQTACVCVCFHTVSLVLFPQLHGASRQPGGVRPGKAAAGVCGSVCALILSSVWPVLSMWHDVITTCPSTLPVFSQSHFTF